MRKRALTLVEMIVGLSIIAIISGIVLVSFTLVDRRRLETEARNLLADLTWAREMAVAQHHNSIVDFDTSNELYVLYLDRDDDSTPDTGEEIKRQRLDVDLVSVTDFSGSPLSPPQRITFNYPNGVAQDRIVNLRHGGRTRPIRVFGDTGFIRLDPVS